MTGTFTLTKWCLSVSQNEIASSQARGAYLESQLLRRLRLGDCLSPEVQSQFGNITRPHVFKINK
jgi:hypothetical protein